MIEHFENLPAAERERILDACRSEFAENGYQRASTNVIVKNAGIPKGTLFFFFGSKQRLFLYLVDTAVGAYRNYMDKNIGVLPSDLFERMFHMFDVRMRFAAENSDWYQFLAKALLDIPDALKKEMASRFADYAKASQLLMQEGLDTSRLRPGVTREQVQDVIGMLQEGLLARYSQRLQKMSAEETLQFVESMRDSTRRQFELLKHGVYRTDQSSNS